MRLLTLLLLALFISGCSSARLKKCGDKALEDPALQVCSSLVDPSKKAFRMCEKPVDLFLCEDPL